MLSWGVTLNTSHRMTDNIRRNVIKESARRVRRDMFGTAWGIKTSAHTYVPTHIHTFIHTWFTRLGPQNPAVTGTHLEPARAIRGFRGVSSECADDFGAMRSPGLPLDQVRDGKYLWEFGVQSDPPRGRGRVTCTSGGDGALLSLRRGSNAAGPRNERSHTERELRLSADFSALGEDSSSTVAVCTLSSGLDGCGS